MARRWLALVLGLWLTVAPAWVAVPLHVCPHTGEIELRASGDCCAHHDSCCTVRAADLDREGPMVAPPVERPAPTDAIALAPPAPTVAAVLGVPPARGPPTPPDRPPDPAPHGPPTFLRIRALLI